MMCDSTASSFLPHSSIVCLSAAMRHCYQNLKLHNLHELLLTQAMCVGDMAVGLLHTYA